MVMCSAPWYWKTRPISGIRPIAQMYPTNTATRIAPSTQVHPARLPDDPPRPHSGEQPRRARRRAEGKNQRPGDLAAGERSLVLPAGALS